MANANGRMVGEKPKAGSRSGGLSPWVGKNSNNMAKSSSSASAGLSLAKADGILAETENGKQEP